MGKHFSDINNAVGPVLWGKRCEPFLPKLLGSGNNLMSEGPQELFIENPHLTNRNPLYFNV
jgi:hypothetical protein